jgi:hypothetical protein
VSQWWIGGLRTRKAKVAGSIPAGGSISEEIHKVSYKSTAAIS